jgi:hypothetical protein
MTKRLLTVAALVLLTTGALAGVTGASSHGSKASAVSQGKLGVRNGVIYGCVETHGNKATLGDLKLGNCSKGFKPIAWNIRGRAGVRGVRGAAGKTGPQGAQGPKGDTGPAGSAGPPGPAGTPAATPEYGLVSVFVDRGSGPTRYATLSGALGSPAGTTMGGDFRFSCTPVQAPCKISAGAAVISNQSGTTVVHPRLSIHKQADLANAPITFCEYADGANNNAGLDTIQRVPTLAAAETAMDTPLSMGIGASLDCGSAQTYSPEVTEIEVPAASASDTAFYDVAASFAFSPGFSLPPGE